MINNQKPPYNPTQPIPNTSGSYPESYYIESPQGTVFLGSGLELNPETGTLSSSGGVSGVPLESTIYSLAVLPNGVVLAGGDSGTVFRSTDNGATWDSGTFLDEGNFNAPVYSLVSVGEGKALASTPNLSFLLLTEDSGLTWSLGFDFEDGGVYSIAYRASDGVTFAGTVNYVWKSTDTIGWSYYDINFPGGASQPTCFAFPGTNRISMGDYYGQICYSSDDGETWTCDGMAGSVYRLASDGMGGVIASYGYSPGEVSRKVSQSVDSGVTWEYSIQVGGAELVPCLGYSNGVFYAGTDYLGRVYKSLDGGLNWQVFYDPSSINATSRAIAFSEDDKILVAINNFVLRVPTTYTPPAPPAPALCTPAYLTVPPTEPPYNCITNVNTSGVTSFSEAWYNCEYIVKFPCVDSSAVTDFSYAWYACSNLSLFPQIDTSLGQDFSYSWGYTRIDRFPPIDTSSATTFNGTWAGCYYLEDFPFLESGSVTDFYNAWGYDYALKNFPLIDTSLGEDFRYTWYDCRSLTSFPELNTGSGVHFDGAWQDCSSLTSFPQLDVSLGENFSSTWQGCSSLTSFPQLDVSSGIYFYGAWQDCSSLTSFPQLDFSNARYFNYAWTNCTSLTSFPSDSLTSCTTNKLELYNPWGNCPLDQTSIDGIISSLDQGGTLEGNLDISENDTRPTIQVKDSANNLLSKGWTLRWSGPSYGCSTGVDPTEELSLNYSWSLCSSLTSFPTLNTRNCLMFEGTWRGCSSLTSFPTLDTSSGTNFNYSWQSCSSLTSFPSIDVGSGTHFDLAWKGCSSLTSFPALNFSLGESFYRSWEGCSSLTSFPAINIGNGTNFFGAWRNCVNLQTFPDLDFSSALAVDEAWAGCSSLTSFPLIDTSKCYGFSGSWLGCSSLTSFPLIPTPTTGYVNFNYAWRGCSSLTSFPLINTVAGRYFGETWRGCSSLTSFPLIDTSNGGYFDSTWQGCTSLTSFPQLDFSSGYSFYRTWSGCQNLANFPANMFDNCVATDFTFAWIGCALTQQSVDNILVSLNTAGRSYGTVYINGGTSSPPGPAGLAAKASLVSRGWTVITN